MPARHSRRHLRQLAMAVGASAALALILLMAGCAHAPRPAAEASEPAPEKIVLDYGNGWYHPASGAESVGQVARRYGKDAALVAELNRCAADAVPAAKTMLYIPPTNNRTRLRSVLARVQERPELIPRQPWDPSGPLKVADAGLKTKPYVKRADPWIANKVKRPAIVEDGDAALASARSVGRRHRNAAAERALAAAPRGGEAPASPAPGIPVNPLNNAYSPSKDVASLSGGASLPSRAARAGENALNELTGQMTQVRQNLAAASGAAPAEPQGESTATAGRGNGHCAWPLQGRVTTQFNSGWRKACHGIEIAAPVGTPVHASRPGRVLMAENFLAYGKLIIIDHGDGFATAYGYNSEMRVRRGDRVGQGQIISLVGTAPHYGPQGKLFFQVRRNSQPVDPLDYLK